MNARPSRKPETSAKPDVIERLRRRQIPAGWILASTLIAIIGLALIFGEHLEILESPPDSTSVLLFLIVAVAILSAANPSLFFSLIRRLQHIEGGGVKLAFQSQYATESLTRSLGAGTSLDEDDSSVHELKPSPSLHRDLRRIKRELDKRIRFLGVVIFNMADNPNEDAVMRRIYASGVLSIEELGVIEAIRTMNVSDFTDLQADERIDRLERIWRVANRFASSYWDAFVREELKRSGFVLFDFEQSRNHRRDFLARSHDRSFVVAARVEVLETEVSKTVERWGKELKDIDSGATSALSIFAKHERVILVPDFGDTARAATRRERELARNFLGVIRLGEFANQRDGAAAHKTEGDGGEASGTGKTAAPEARILRQESKRTIPSVGDRSEARRQRQLIVCCDGTWNVPDNDKPTNVGRIAELASAPNGTESNARERIVYYVRGVGGRYKLDKLIGGGLGSGLHVNIRDAYAFIVQNYQPGDEIFLFGFSRGATTVRAVAGMIAKVGLLKPNRINELNRAYRLYRNDQLRSRDRIKSELPSEALWDFNPLIKFLGVFDTVGALGVPLRVFDRSVKFKNHQLPDRVAFARQALALDERRWTFGATLWEKSPNLELTNLYLNDESEFGAGEPVGRIKQKWFVGCHSDVGGGYRFDKTRDQGLHNLGSLTLEWMLQEAKSKGFDYSEEAKNEIFARPGLTTSTGAKHEVHNSMNPGYLLLGAIDWISQVVLKGGFSLRARRLLTSDAVDQSVHESVWRMYFCDARSLNSSEFALATSRVADLTPVVVRHRTTIQFGKERPFPVRRHRDLRKIVAEVLSRDSDDFADTFEALSNDLETQSFEPHWPMNLTSRAAGFVFGTIRDVGRWVIDRIPGRPWKSIAIAGTLCIAVVALTLDSLRHALGQIFVDNFVITVPSILLALLVYNFAVNRNYL